MSSRRSSNASYFAERFEATFTPPAWRNIYEADNPLGIAPRPRRSDNYILILGDWGKPRHLEPKHGAAPRGAGECQWEVAARMADYVRAQAAAGKKLLFVANVGDSFYWNGVAPGTDESWRKQWAELYGVLDPASPLHGVPFLSVMGNHDYGARDCAANATAAARPEPPRRRAHRYRGAFRARAGRAPHA